MPEEEVYEIAGEKVSRQDWLDFKNNQSWRKANTETAETLSAKERVLLAREEALAAKERALALKDVEAPRGREAAAEDEDEDEADPELPPLPNPIDDPVEFARVIEQREKILLKHGREMSRKAAARAKQGVAEARQAAMTTAADSAAAQADYQANRETIKDYFDEMEKAGHPVPAALQPRLIKHMDSSLRIPDEGMGQRGRSGVFVFTKEALAAADAFVRRDYWREQAKNEGYAEAEKAGAANGKERDGLPLSAGKPPGSSATGQELFEYAQRLPAKAQDRFINNLPPKQLDAFLKYLPVGLEQAEVGA